MSSSVTVVGGVNGSSISGSVTVPLGGLSSTALAALQSSLAVLSAGVAAGSEGLTNDNLLTGIASGQTITGSSNLLELTNTDSVGATTSGSITSVVGVSNSYNAVVVQAPGALTINGSGGSTNYVLGAASNVELFTNGGSNTIVAGGGNDNLKLFGSNAVTLGGGQDTALVFAGSNTVVATGSASATIATARGYAGTIDFTNASSVAASVNANAGSATVFGGTGGGTFQGGTSGSNLLVGGSGSVVLVGAGNNDTLMAGGDGATSSAGSNYLYAGVGNETLLASSVTGTNLFNVGFGQDVISTAGSGTQYFFGSSGNASITGSTTSGSNNIYFFGNATGQGGNDIISNFGTTNSQLIAINGVNIQAISEVNTNGVAGALVTLSDGTSITLSGVSASSIVGSVGGNTIV